MVQQWVMGKKPIPKIPIHKGIGILNYIHTSVEGFEPPTLRTGI